MRAVYYVTMFYNTLAGKSDRKITTNTLVRNVQ